MTPVSGIIISDIELLNPPDPFDPWLGRPKFFVKVNYGSKREAKTAEKYPDKGRVRWEESIPLDIANITDNPLITLTVKKCHVRTEKIGSFRHKVIDLISIGESILEISKDCQLKFTIGETPNILPTMIDQASQTRAAASQEDTWLLLLFRLEIFVDAIDAASALNPYAKLAWSIFSSIPKTILSQNNRNKTIVKLCEKLKDVYDYITDAERLPKLEDITRRNKILESLVQQTIECAYFIREYGTRSTVGNFWRGSSIDDQVISFNERLDQYLNAITSSITLENGIVTLGIGDTTAEIATLTLRIADTTSETKELILLNEMPYARDAGFVSGKQCLPGTRLNLIDGIIDWVNSDAPQQILLLSGQAGTGKSAVAHTIAEIFMKQNRLGSIFCFNRSYKDRCNLLFSTISRGLADSDVFWRERLVEVIQNTAIRTSLDPVTQLNKLIVEPAKSVATVGPVVIVIDALDESGNREERAAILDLIFKNCSELPSNYRFIVTSRPEQDIEFLCQETTAILVKRMGDVPINETFFDIRRYVSSRLNPIASVLDKIEEDWSNTLAKRAGGLFQWAETACRVIKPTVKYEPTIRKQWLICISGSMSSLGEFYEKIISSQPECGDPQFVDEFKAVVGVLMVAREPLTINMLQNLLQDIVPDVQSILNPFGSLFLGVDNPAGFIQPLHTSLFDFLSNRNAVNTRYYVDTIDQNNLTFGCLKLMNRMLRFNICGLETSHLCNRNVPNFQERVSEAVPPHLSYACRFWAAHLHFSDLGHNLISEIRVLMDDNLLFWFEVLSLLGEIERGCSAMSILRDWSQNADSDLTTLATQASDACHFGLTCKEAMSGSTPHLYLSALPFAPRDSFIFKKYLSRYSNLIGFDVDQPIDFNPSEAGVTKRHPSSVPITHLTFSPCDRYIANGFGNGDIYLMDCETGEQITQWKPTTKSGIISDIVFSPDGEVIYGCFPHAGRILIWNTQTNDVKEESHDSIIGGPCYFSTISSDGRHIAFACYNSIYSEVLVYDRMEKSVVYRFQAQPDTLIRPQFSPNGNLFASGQCQSDWILRTDVSLWNVRERVEVKTWRYSDGLALGNDYIAVRTCGKWEICDVTTMKSVHNFGNSGLIGRVRLSADDQYVFSSHRNVYRIWTLSTGQLIHESRIDADIRCLALSPDLKYIALADSEDAGTTYIRQWTAHNLQQSTPDNSSFESPIQNLWLHGDNLVLLFQNGFLQIWDITTMNTIVFEAKIGKRPSTLPSVFFSENDVYYVAYGVYQGHGSCGLCLWNKSNGQCILDSFRGVVTALSFSSSNNYLIFGVVHRSSDRRGSLKIWDIARHCLVAEALYSVEGTPVALAFSSSGTHVRVAYTKEIDRDYHAENICRDSHVYFETRECHPDLQVSAGRFRCSVRSRFSIHLGDHIAFSANKVLFLSGKGVEIFDATTGKEVCWIKQDFSFSGCQRRLSPNGKYLAWRKDDELTLWDVDANKLLLAEKFPVEKYIHPDIHDLSFSEDSTQLTTVIRNDYITEDPMNVINVMSRPGFRCYSTTVWDIQTSRRIINKVQIPSPEKDNCIQGVLHNGSRHVLHEGHYVAGWDFLPCPVWSIRVLSAIAKLYHHHVAETAFGAFPVSIAGTGSPAANLNADSEEVLDYSLTAWNKALFSTFSEIGRNGWVLGPHKELLFWVPKDRRKHFWYPGTKHMATAKITKLNFRNFVHGTRWTECRKTL